MPRIAKEMGPLEVSRIKHPGGKGNAMIAVGGVPGLYMQVAPTGARSWILRARRTEPAEDRRKVVWQRDIGLGGFPGVTLAQARETAREMREMIARGLDPKAERDKARHRLKVAKESGLTFGQAAKKYIAAKVDPAMTVKQSRHWQSSLDRYAMPALGDRPVSAMTVQDVLKVLEPIWAAKTETATRLRGRIEAILSWATVAGHRKGDNPARWRGNLRELLPAPAKLAKSGNFPALAIDDAPRWFAELRQREGFGARALEFLALTASRSGEVRGAIWGEIDLERGVWTVPAARMKARRDHRVPLSPSALELLQALPRLDETELVFPSARGGQLSDMTLSGTMRRIHEAAAKKHGKAYTDPRSGRPAVPHGLRSSFRDWAAERTHYPGEMAEVALAHRVSNAVEAAYRRGDMLEKRRKMMADWARYLRGELAASNIVRFRN
jgi:integrase